MPISASGTTAMSQINTELGRSSNSLISLDNAENGTYATINVNSAIRPASTNPASISEWRGYNHSAAAPTTTTTTTTAAPAFGGGGNDGVTNQYINFNQPTSQYARTGNVPWLKNYTYNTSFSIAMWVKYTQSNGSVMYLFHSRNSDSTSFFDNNIWFRFGFSNQFGMSGQSSGNASSISFNSPPTLNTWTHIIMTFNGTTKAANVYYNLTNVGTGTLSSVTFNTTSERNIAFGGLAGSTPGNYTGAQFDEVGFYNIELNSSQRTAIYNNRAHFSLTGTTGLVENWKFNGNGNSSTGTANFTLYNSPTFANSPTTY